jgi:hypothetical protein
MHVISSIWDDDISCTRLSQNGVKQGAIVNLADSSNKFTVFLCKLFVFAMLTDANIGGGIGDWPCIAVTLQRTKFFMRVSLLRYAVGFSEDVETNSMPSRLVNEVDGYLTGD